MKEQSSCMKIEEVRLKASQCEEGCFKAIEGNAKEYQIRSMELAVVSLNPILYDRTTNCNYADQWVIPSATKYVNQFTGLECDVFRLLNKVSSVGVTGHVTTVA
ncbi:hypothetical protein Tco_1262790 [Tanacetum coccineum]